MSSSGLEFRRMMAKVSSMYCMLSSVKWSTIDRAFSCGEHEHQTYTFYSKPLRALEIHKQPTSSFCLMAGEASLPNRRMVVWRSITLWMVGIRSSSISLKGAVCQFGACDCNVNTQALPDSLGMPYELLFFQKRNKLQ